MLARNSPPSVSGPAPIRRPWFRACPPAISPRWICRCRSCPEGRCGRRDRSAATGRWDGLPASYPTLARSMVIRVDWLRSAWGCGSAPHIHPGALPPPPSGQHLRRLWPGWPWRLWRGNGRRTLHMGARRLLLPGKGDVQRALGGAVSRKFVIAGVEGELAALQMQDEFATLLSRSASWLTTTTVPR